MKSPGLAKNIVILAHYFPPLNSSGARRMESMAKYFVREGREVSVITTRKIVPSSVFTELVPDGVRVFEIDAFGRCKPSIVTDGGDVVATTSGSSDGGLRRKIKDFVLATFGQLPDPRLPFGLAIISPLLDRRLLTACRTADIVLASSPPWPMLLAALLFRLRFGCAAVLDYRDHFSDCYSMPGSRLAKVVEKIIDRFIARRADLLVVISDPMRQYYSQWSERVSVIMNGFDHDIMEEARRRVSWRPREPYSPVVIRYVGRVSSDSVPKTLLAAISRLHAESLISPDSIRFEYYGEWLVLRELILRDHPELLNYFAFFALVPHASAIELMITADYLLFAETSSASTLSAQGVLTTKLFEYIGAGRPILADIGGTTLAGKLISRIGDHHFVSSSVEEFYIRLKSPQFYSPCGSSVGGAALSLSRSEQSRTYLSLLDSLCAG